MREAYLTQMLSILYHSVRSPLYRFCGIVNVPVGVGVPEAPVEQIIRRTIALSPVR